MVSKVLGYFSIATGDRDAVTMFSVYLLVVLPVEHSD